MCISFFKKGGIFSLIKDGFCAKRLVIFHLMEHNHFITQLDKCSTYGYYCTYCYDSFGQNGPRHHKTIAWRYETVIL